MANPAQVARPAATSSSGRERSVASSSNQIVTSEMSTKATSVWTNAASPTSSGETARPATSSARRRRSVSTRRATAAAVSTTPTSIRALSTTATWSPRQSVMAEPAASTIGHNGGHVVSGRSMKNPSPSPARSESATAM